MEKREKLKSRLGFILLSAGCAIGIGNVWRFPYVAGENGGGVFVLFYILFLAIFAVPILTMEFAVGRASQRSIMCAYQSLEKKGHKWHLHGWAGLFGSSMLMAFYTSVSGWMMYYFYKYVIGEFDGIAKESIAGEFDKLMADPLTMMLWTAIAIILGFLICSLGLQNGVERITKIMMIALLILIVVLAIHSMTLEGGVSGLKFYLVPDFSAIQEKGILSIIVAAMNQSFFTLSLGMGSMMIFGSYINKDRALFGEAVTVAGLDTFVAICSGLIIFPACFAYGVQPDAGPSLIFITLPNVFAAMPFGKIWGALFFLFMSFAALSTVITVFECIISCIMDKWNLSRIKACVLCFAVIMVISVPCVLGFNVWSDFRPFGDGTGVLDLEDFIVSNILLPVGSIVLALFCSHKFGWGFDNYIEETNAGKGLKMPKWVKPYFQWVLPIITFILFIYGIFSVAFKIDIFNAIAGLFVK